MQNNLHSPGHVVTSPGSRSLKLVEALDIKPKVLRQDDLKRMHIMKTRPYGLPSNEISYQRDKFMASFGGGSVASCLSGSYEQDYLMDV